MFEYVYLARPDSVIDGVSVYQARLNFGETLAQRVISTMPPNEIDVVIPIPESSRPSAMQLAQKIGEAVSRRVRQEPLRRPHLHHAGAGGALAFGAPEAQRRSCRSSRDRNVLLVDDSIVRGTTSKEIVQMAREAGARKVYMASAAPPVRYPNVYGIDMPTKEELIAHGRSVEEIRRFIGADALIYQDVDAMKRVVKALNPRARRLRGVVLRRRLRHRRRVSEAGAAPRAAAPDEDDDAQRSRLGPAQRGRRVMSGARPFRSRSLPLGRTARSAKGAS